MHGLLRFRTDDVLLGTSGVGMCVCSLGNVLRVWAAARTLPGRPTSILLTTAGNPSSIEWPPVRNRQLDPTILFSHLSGLNFALDASYGFELAFSGRPPGRGALVVFSSREFSRIINSAVDGQLGAHMSRVDLWAGRL